MSRLTKHISRCVVCLLLVLCMLPQSAFAVSVGASKYGKNYNKNVTLTGNYATDIVTIAKAQKGKTKSNLAFSSAWCDAFVLDCARMANIPTSVIPNVRGCKAMYQAILKAGGYVVSKSSAKAGDIVFYDCPKCGKFPHVGIYCGNNYVCEGNVGGCVVYSDRTKLYYGDTGGHYSNGTVKMIYVRPNYGSTPAPATTFTVVYNGNGGSGSMSNTTITYGKDTALAKNAFTYTGKMFAGWNVQRASDGKWLYSNGVNSVWYAKDAQPAGYLLYTYPDGANVSNVSAVDKDVCTFTAVWTDKSTEITMSHENWYPSKLVKGSSQTVSGVVESNYPLTKVTATVTDSSGNVKFTASASPNTTAYELYNLDSKMTFSKLAAGNYVYKVTASNAYKTVTLTNRSFIVKASFSSSTSGLKYPTELTYGNGFTVGGTITSSAALTYVGASISTTAGKVLTKTTKAPNAKTFNISTVASALDFSKLPVGTYLYRLECRDSSGYSQFTVTLHFNVKKAGSAPNWPAASLSVPYACETVSSSDLPAGWIWYGENQGVELIPGVPTTLKAVYNGNDKGNYNNEVATVTVTRGECTHQSTKIVDASPTYTGDKCCTACEIVLEEGTVIPPQAPAVSVSGIAASGKNKLSWKTVEYAVSYRIYRATSKNGSYTKLTETTATSYTDTSGKAGVCYYYYVVAVAEDGTVSANSSTVKRTCDCARPVVTVSNYASTGKLNVKWNAVEGAVSYKVYRAKSGSTKYTLLKTVTGTKYYDGSAVAGTKYFYKVVAISANSYGNSDYSAAKGCTCDLRRPTLTLKSNAATGKTVLTWKAIDGASSYKVYRATSKNGKYTLVKTTSYTKYTDNSAVAGTKYYYKVIAISSNKYANSAYSAVKYRTCALARPAVTASTNADGVPVLKWTAIKGAVGYQIYRATAKDGTYTLIKTTSATTFTNATAMGGKTYYYKVVAMYDNESANSAYSAVVSIKAK